MNWTTIGDIHKSGPYQIVGGIRGYSVWLYLGGISCIKRELPSLTEAKKFVEHWASNGAPKASASPPGAP